MKRVPEIEREIAAISQRLYALKQELEQIRKTCPHEFEKNAYTQVCARCGLTEPLYY